MQERKKIRLINEFLKKEFGDNLGDTVVTTGEDGMRYSEYSSKGNPYISMDGSPMYSLLNYGEDGWRFQTRFTEFLSSHGLWYEQGNAWNLNVYED